MTKLMIHLKQGREKNLLQNAFQAYSNYEVGKIPSSSFQSAKFAIFCKVIQHFQHMHQLRTKMLDYSWILKVCQMHDMVSKQMEYMLTMLKYSSHQTSRLFKNSECGVVLRGLIVMDCLFLEPQIQGGLKTPLTTSLSKTKSSYCIAIYC